MNAYRAYVAWGGKNSCERRVEARSCLRLRGCKQFEIAFRETYTNVTPQVLHAIHCRRRRPVTQQLVEYINGAQTNLSLKGCRRFRKPTTCMAAALEADIIDVRHRYVTCRLDSEVKLGCHKFPNEVFKASSEGVATDVSEVASTRATPEWFSPSASSLGLPGVDIHTLRYWYRSEDKFVVHDCWQGEFSQAEFLVGCVHTPATGGRR